MSDFSKIFGPIYGDIQICNHEEDCKNAKMSCQFPNTTNHSPYGNIPASTSIVHIHSVGFVGSVGGQNNENVQKS